MELMAFILRIIPMIQEEMLADVAVTKVAKESGIPFETAIIIVKLRMQKS